MTSVKSLLLGTAAGLMAIAGAQAADMPVKAKPAEYVKICTLYGAGFYYIPGTDTCIKIGGYVRVQTDLHGGNGGIVDGSQQMAAQARFTRDLTNDINYRVRGVATFDARTQTEYGTLRSYFRAGWENTTPAATGGGTTAIPFWDRAFIQFAGFTVGRAQSFFDMFTYGGAYSYLNVRTSGDTGASGQNLWAYTVQFGNGVSYSVSLEDPATRKIGTCDGTAACWAVNGALTYDNAFAVNNVQFGFRVPDIITNLRVDQAWGYVGVSTAIHDASGAYYLTPNNVNNGHPANKYGWAFSASGLLNLQGGDIVGVTFVWSKGAPGYATNSNAWQYYNSSQSVGIGWLADGIYDTGRDIELTNAWSINAGYQHVWGAAGTWGGKWRTSVYGGYVNVSYNDRAKEIILSHLPGAAGSRPCGVPVAGAVWPPLNIQPGTNDCSPDFSFYQIGSRTQFNPHPLMDIGLDVFYTRLNSAFKGATPGLYPANGSRPAVNVIDDQSTLTAIVRWQRNFYP